MIPLPYMSLNQVQHELILKNITRPDKYYVPLDY